MSRYIIASFVKPRKTERGAKLGLGWVVRTAPFALLLAQLATAATAPTCVGGVAVSSFKIMVQPGGKVPDAFAQGE